MTPKAAEIHASLNKTSSADSDRILFSSVKNLDSGGAKVQFDPKLVESIRSEDYARLLRNNTDIYTRLSGDRKSTFSLAVKMGDSLAKKIGDMNGGSATIAADMENLEARLEKERVFWGDKLKELSSA